MMQEGRGEWEGNSLLQFPCIHRQCQSHSMAAILWWVCVTTSQNKLKLFQWSSVFLWMIHIVRDSSKTQDRQHVCHVNMCLFIIIFENNTHPGLYDGFGERHCSLTAWSNTDTEFILCYIKAWKSNWIFRKSIIRQLNDLYFDSVRQPVFILSLFLYCPFPHLLSLSCVCLCQSLSPSLMGLSLCQ